jgi:hypothetical protein
MKLTHKLGRPGYKSGINMSPLDQRYSNNNMQTISDFAFDTAQNYQDSRDSQMSQMTQEQLENLQHNDTIFNPNNTTWNENQVALSNRVPNNNQALSVPIYPPKSISIDSNYEVVNPVDPSLNRPVGDARNADLLSIPEILSYSPGRKKNLVRSSKEGKTTVRTFKDPEGNQISQPYYGQLISDVEKARLAQEAYDADAKAKVASSQ